MNRKLLRGSALLWLLLGGCRAEPTEPADGWAGLELRAVSESIPGAPTTLVAADATGDGRLDLLVVAAGSGQVRVFRTLPTLNGGVDDHSLAPDLRHAAVGDFDRDGIPDLAGAGHFDNAAIVRLGTGFGGFAPAASYPLRNHGRLVAVADLNGDGRDDLVAVHDGSGQPVYVSVLASSPEGVLQQAWEASTPYANARDIALADLDGNGALDIVIATGDDRAALLLYHGVGNGSFGQAIALPSTLPGVPDGLMRIAAADVNGDGRADLLATHYDNTNMLSVRLGSASGLLPPRQQLLSGPVDLAVADVDRDGNQDVIVSLIDEGRIEVLLGDGAGNFTQGPAYSVGSGPVHVVAADFDGDGWADVAVANIVDSRIRVLMNRAAQR